MESRKSLSCSVVGQHDESTRTGGGHGQRGVSTLKGPSLVRLTATEVEADVDGTDETVAGKLVLIFSLLTLTI